MQFGMLIKNLTTSISFNFYRMCIPLDLICGFCQRRAYNKIVSLNPPVQNNLQHSQLDDDYNPEIVLQRIKHITWEDETILQHPRFKKNLAVFKKFNPGWAVYFYTDAAVDFFIKTNFPKDIYNAYLKINPSFGAMKADFFRYCVLYIHGGLYVDIFKRIKGNLGDFFDERTDCYLLEFRSNIATRHWWREQREGKDYEQWFLMFKPRHPYLKLVIESISTAILNHHIPELSNGILNSGPTVIKQMILKLTGPDKLTEIINGYIKDNAPKHITLTRKQEKHMFNEDVKLKTEMYRKSSRKHYSKTNDTPLFLNMLPTTDDLPGEHLPKLL